MSYAPILPIVRLHLKKKKKKKKKKKTVRCSAIARAYRLYEKRACNFHGTCTVGKILIVAKNSNQGMGGAKWKPFS